MFASLENQDFKKLFPVYICHTNKEVMNVNLLTLFIKLCIPTHPVTGALGIELFI